MEVTVGGAHRLLDSQISFVSKAVTMAPISSANHVNASGTGYMEPVTLVKFNPAFAALLIAMIASIFLVGFLMGLLKRCIPPSEADDDNSLTRRRFPDRSARQASKSQRGLDPEIVQALPLIHYKDLPTDQKVKKCDDCLICLAPFDSGDLLRLLPECSHAFHSDCIGAWFQSHSTCPLCRACLAHPAEEESRQDQDGDHSVNDEQEGTRESGDIDIVELENRRSSERDASGVNTTISEERVTGARAGSMPAGEEEGHHRAPLLSNLVGSFTPAVRLVVVPEKFASLASIRRSSSTGTDLLQVPKPSYIVDSEGTQHNRKLFQSYSTDSLPKHQLDLNGSPSTSTSLEDLWSTADLEAGASSATHLITNGEISTKPSGNWSTRWKFRNLRYV
ncbi:uncharacterized protein [Physcomitrium patens]|uniref:RING-type E3 ubiquitin transferase n=1 Tax=Physcomitrium patens TaxID=3218 RepID=A0A7I4ELC3_PHYPA|nr:RING-H2 finger protein ATL32-like isoform X2 [Physcomitrium patens]|eukprot:XP_024385351.1 RING-H2 finger protein ATL32-like isoform X2 [Physcomitrella patens]